MIEFFDDKKEKYMSHEAHFTEVINGVYCFCDVEIIGYGITKEDALENLQKVLRELVSKITEGSNV